MAIHLVNSCCGFRDFHGLAGKTPKTILQEVLSCDGVASHILFTDRRSNDVMPKLVSVIESLGLGEIVQGPVEANPGSGVAITGWIFAPNYGKIRTFVNNF